MDINGVEVNVDCGIGYARLAIQKLAEYWQRKQIFMIDDNCVSIHEMQLRAVDNREHLVKKGRRNITKSVPLFRALKHLERMFCHGDKRHDGIARIMEMDAGKYPPDENVRHGGYPKDSLAMFTGDSMRY